VGWWTGIIVFSRGNIFDRDSTKRPECKFMLSLQSGSFPIGAHQLPGPLLNFAVFLSWSFLSLSSL